MQIDMSQIPLVHSYVTVPAGTYVCRIAEVREGITRDGSPRWAFRLEIADGEYAGRTGAWDALIWSERGLPRVKTVLSRLGYDTSGVLEIEPDDLLGRRLCAELIEEVRESADGTQVERMRVPFDGYREAPAETPF